MFGFNKQKRLNAKLIRAAAAGNVRDIALLLDAGADIETRQGAHWGDTALGTAAYKGQLPAVTLLLDRGANINAADMHGDGPLMNAMFDGNRDIILELLRRGADKSIKNNRGLTPMDRARKCSAEIRADMGIPEEKPSVPAVDPDIAADPDEIILRRRVGDKIIAEAFNFAARERISMVRSGPDGPVEAMTRESFDAIGERSLRRAFEVYAGQGGAIPESEVFPAAIAKVKPRPGAA